MRRSRVLASLVLGLLACGGKPAPVQPGMGPETMEPAPAPAAQPEPGAESEAKEAPAQPGMGRDAELAPSPALAPPPAAPMAAPPPPEPDAAPARARRPASPAKKTKAAPKAAPKDTLRADPCEGGE